MSVAHNGYVSELLSAPEESSPSKPVPTKRFWFYIKSKKSHDVGVAPLKDNNVDVNDSFGKANILSNQFKSVFTKGDLDKIPSTGPSPYPDVPPTVFTIPGIFKLLNNVSPKKANGPDPDPMPHPQRSSPRRLLHSYTVPICTIFRIWNCAK